MGHERQIGLSEEEKDKKRECTRNRYGNMSIRRQTKKEYKNKRIEEHISRKTTATNKNTNRTKRKSNFKKIKNKNCQFIVQKIFRVILKHANKIINKKTLLFLSC